MNDQRRGYIVLTVNTLAFMICFAAWMMNSVLITYLVDNDVYQWDKAQMGWLIGIPVLTGAVARLPGGILTDRYGGRIVFGTLLLISSVPMFLVSFADSYLHFLLTGLGFGLTGASFAIGIAYTSVWFSPERQGTALGIFGAGNAGAALTAMGAPFILRLLTDNGANLEGWRTLPQIYAATLVITGVLFFLLTHSRKVEQIEGLTLMDRLSPLRHIRVWRFGLYYFLVFGGFVALAQWLVPYYVNAYSMTIASAGLMTSIFSLPSGVIRALGGWMSDYWGARTVMYWVLGICVICFILLIVPRMDIQSPGQGVTAARTGTVTSVGPDEIIVADKTYALSPRQEVSAEDREEGVLVFPTSSFWHEPVVDVGDEVEKKELLARGVTNIYFQANVWIFTAFVFIAGIAMGIGKAAVYKHIPDYFPNDVGVVGGMVGVLGGLGGFICPVIFGYLLRGTGIWTTAWMFLAIVSVISLVWMHLVIQRMMKQRTPTLVRQFEEVTELQPNVNKAD
ncbi:MAG: MFS transporter [SAR202 cluster bacterium]|jgi:NNP family nitrate/nitrite transporter-like MFS transporter|nr:MFS transporter [SAR202 cluster bacterium]MDP6512585.1 MFS transporter [SAR202 cluster bacterium]MDP6715452.1 MFS transporter [SAR202 cluster bacterium]